MTRLEAVDKWLLALFVPIWLVCFTLHIREVARTGIAMPPAFASPRGAEAYPVVGGFHLERSSENTGLLPGDVLLRAGDVDLRGVGAIGFDAHAVAEAGPDLRVPLVIERDGARREVALELRPFPVPWFRIPAVLGLAGLALVVHLRGRASPSNRRVFIGGMLLAISQSLFPGSSYWQTVAAWPVFYLGNPLGIAMIALWAIGFPDHVAEDKRLSTRWAWLLGLASLVPRISYLLGGPVPAPLIPVVEHASDALFFAGLFGIFAWNHYHSGPAGRRALRWVLYGFGIPALSLAALLAVPTVVPGFSRFEELLGWLGLAGILAIMGFTIAIVRYGLFDIDRMLSATATYSVVAVVLIGGTVSVVPALARMMDDYTGMGTQTAQLALSLGFAALAVPAYRRIRPRVDRFFFPERLALESGTQRLLEDLADCRLGEEVWELVDERIEALLRAEGCVAFVREGHDFVVSPHERLGELHFDARDRLLSHLAAHSAPVSLEGEGVPEPEPATHAVLESLGTRVLIPIRRGKDLAAVICLAPKRSGDIYTQTDLALLGAIAEGAAGRLRQLGDAELIVQERERAEELRELKEEAERANLAKSRFLAAASHDLRQPLHALGLFVDALDERVQDETLKPLVGRIQSSTGSLTEMFNALLDISRLDAGSVAPELTDFELAPLFDRLSAELREQAAAKGVELRCVGSSGVVRSDPVLFGRIVQNLLTNAIRYTDSGRVLLGVRRRGDDLRVEVWDTGAGIPDARLREIFEEFVQLEGDKAKGGLGLGLSIVDRLARLLGHELTVRSWPGQGSFFAVTAPRRERLEATAVEPEPAPGDELAGRCVLLVDDEAAILAATSQRLEAWGFRAIAASSREEALAKVRALGRAPDAILADYRLSETSNGLEVVTAIRELLGDDVPAAIVSGDASESPLDAIRASGLPLLRKPVRPAKLRAVLTQLLKGETPPTRPPA